VQTLNAAEATQVASWLFLRVPVLFRQMVSVECNCVFTVLDWSLKFLLCMVCQIARVNPSLTKAQQNTLVCEHLPHLLPGSSEEIASYFVSSLHLSADGRIAKDDFVKSWNRHARLLFPSSHHRSSVKGTVYCTIL
jgi:hypothetical protein